MIRNHESSCPTCKRQLKYYDSVWRIVRTKHGQSKRILIGRFRCKHCCTIHRALPDFIVPYKQYEKEIIRGVIEGLITSSTFGFEDYPCEMTMKRWKQ